MLRTNKEQGSTEVSESTMAYCDAYRQLQDAVEAIAQFVDLVPQEVEGMQVVRALSSNLFASFENFTPLFIGNLNYDKSVGKLSS